jgi:hypothetical protein
MGTFNAIERRLFLAMESSGSSILRRGENGINDLVNSSTIIYVARLLDASQHISDPRSSHTSSSRHAKLTLFYYTTQQIAAFQVVVTSCAISNSALRRSLVVGNDDDEVIRNKRDCARRRHANSKASQPCACCERTCRCLNPLFYFQSFC